MTTAAETTEEAKKAALEARTAAMEAEEKELNKDRTGKGTRVFLSMTRGRNPQKVQYENWDEKQPATLPVTYNDCLAEMKTRGFTEADIEPAMVKRFILGDNELFYKEASDPVAEYVDKTWPEEIQKGFRLVVRNFSANNNVTIEEAANLIKPAYVASQTKK